MTREELRARWEARLTECTRFGVTMDGASICREVLADIDALLASEDDRYLGLADAADWSGYSRDHLRRLYRDGALKGERRGRRLFFRSADLPRKARTHHASGPYDPVADARNVLARLNLPPRVRV